MKIEKVNIENYKCFKGSHTFSFKEGINILVGNNEAGKSTILEAINLALTGIIGGKSIKSEVSQYLFNNQVVNDYISSLTDPIKKEPPSIVIEVFFIAGVHPKFEGDYNSDGGKATGISFKIEFDEICKSEYEALITSEAVTTIPIEYYHAIWKSFSREVLTPKAIPIKSVLIDSTSNKYQNGSDVYLTRVIRNDLTDKEKADLSQAHRKMKEAFIEADSVKALNAKIQLKSKLSEKNIKVSVDLSSQNSWETTLMTYLDEIPFHQIGKGEQCIIKTNLALAHQKAKEANLLLIEEPENHLSHTKLNELTKRISDNKEEKQIIISTHSSYVCNKLGLKNLILLHNQTGFALSALEQETFDFFKKLAGYQTLRLILCKKAVLVEGDSDELVFQKAYMDKHSGRLPIEDGIDVIAVKLTFKRFLEIAIQTKQKVAVITDNDGNYDVTVLKKYDKYYKYPNIKIFSDNNNHLNTLEPQFIEANNLNISSLTSLFELNTKSDYNAVLKYMLDNKTSWALKVFDSTTSYNYPKYIVDAVDWCDEK